MNLSSHSLLFFICMAAAQFTYAKDPANVYCDCNPTVSDTAAATCTCSSSLTGNKSWSLAGLASRGIHAHCTGISVYEDSGENTGTAPTYQARTIDMGQGVACDGQEIYIQTTNAAFSCTNWTIYNRSVEITSVSCRAHGP